MPKQKTELVPAPVTFDYSLVGDAADKVRSSAEKIRRTVQKTLDDLIEVGPSPHAAREKAGPGLGKG